VGLQTGATNQFPDVMHDDSERMSYENLQAIDHFILYVIGPANEICK
jgi:hypothetical protein